MLSETREKHRRLVGRKDALTEVAAGLATAAGAVVVGPSGIGKTALIRAVADGQDFHVVNIRGSSVSRNTPFGALAWLISELPEDVAARPEQLLQELDSLMSQRAGGKRILLLLDNVEVLDHWTGMAVAQLVRRSGVRILATAEAFSKSPPDIFLLWTEGLLHRVDLGVLDVEQTRELMQNILGGRVSSIAAQSMQRHSEGNPQLVSLLTQEQADEGCLVRQDGIWGLAKPLVYSGQVAELITARLRRLPPVERSLVQLLALSGELPLSIVLKLFPAETVDALEEARVLEIAGQGIRLASGGTASAIAAAIPPGRSRELWEAVSALVDPVSLGPSAVIRYARWTLACQGELAPETALRAARLSTASDDPEAALQFIRAVPVDARNQAMLLEEVRALRESGDYPGALDIFERIPSAPDPEQPGPWVDLMLQKASLLQVMPHHGDPVAVVDRISAAVETVGKSGTRAAWQARVVLMRSSLAIDGGNPGAVPAQLAALASDRTLSLPSRLQAIALRAQFLAITGNGEELLTLAPTFTEEFRGSSGANSLDAVHIRMFEALVAAGEHRLAEQLVADLMDGANRPAFQGSSADVANGLVHALTGREDSALAALTSATSQIRLQDPFDVLPLVQILSAHVLALRGDLDAAEQELAAVGDFKFRPQQLMALIWHTLRLEARLAGDRPELCRELRSLARSSLDQGMVPIGLHCLAAATQHGDPGAARELAAAAALANGRWARALYCFGTGHVQENAALLLECAEAATELGHELLCNSAAQAALRLLEGRADNVSRSQARNALTLEHRSFRKLRLANTVSELMKGLTPFEAELARRAAGPATRKEMSEELHLSPRTIDWHLGKIFDKLHVSGRAELGEVLR